MNTETLQLLKDLRDQLAVSLAWPASESIRSRLNVAILRAEPMQKTQQLVQKAQQLKN